ncbi:LacI family transcriptional regulator [Actinoplanes sp. NBC_00393]|uniref:LacI family DNA-binding transcriptional regulator n=1 Tax=Actinoplanes sp. NBC_00393 TaxID=2975953 RepID=UPI002E23FA3D
MAVTLADVARLAGVSPATVSRVINDSAKRVNEDLRERVLAAVAQLHYVPNAHAQHVARPRKSAVGVIVHDVSDPYFAEITRGLQRQAGAHDRLLVICNSYREPERELAYVALLRAQQVHALILAGSGYHDDAFTERLNAELGAYQQAGGRVAVIGRHRLVGSAVLPANEAGAHALGLRLLGLGHREVAVIAGPRWLTTTTDRLTGFRRAAEELGVELPPSRIVYTDFTRDGGAVAAAELLDTDPGLTALVALNDSMAVGALAALRERGVRVPDDISVTGFDDMPIARDVTPSLTTVKLPLVEMGERAMALALGDDPHPRSEPAEATTIWRESCAKPR